MANGYIGKISAVVTANTSDLSRKLSGAVGDVDKFANRVASSIERSSQNAQDSLSKIFTPLQRLQRNIQAGLAGNVFRRDNVEQYIRSVQQAVSISEQLGKPLTAGASQFQKLTLEVQGAFLPALNRAQTAVISLSTTLQQQGSVSERSLGQVEAVVNSTTKAIQRLTQAQQLASQSFTGNELQFGNPRLFETLSANARTTQRAAALPASALVDGDIARQIRALEQYQNAAVEAAARVESLRLEPNVRPEVLIAAERRLENVIETASRAGQAVEASIGAANRAAAAPQRAADNEIALLQRREQAAKQVQDQQNAAAQRVADNEIALLQRREAAAKQVEDQRAAMAQRAADNEIALLQRREQTAKQIEDERAARAQRAADNEIALIIRREQAARDAETQRFESAPVALGGRLAEQGRRRVQGLTGNVNLNATDILSGQSQRDIDALASRVGQVRQQLESLPNSIRTQFIPALQQAQQQLIRLQNSPTATVNEINQAAAAVQRLEQNARRAATAFDFRSQFGGAGIEGIEQGLNEQALRGYTAQLQLLQQTLAGTSQAARGPAVQAFDRLRTAIANAMDNGTIATEATRRTIRQLTTEAANAAAAAANISPGDLNRRLQRAGDVGRGAFGNAGLAVQQLVFAFDDFFSVTGGLDQRIRAAGNNISQLGFVIGGTAGLIGGVLVAAIAQGLVALIKWRNAGVETQDQQKALNDALQKQKTIVDELARAYENVADAIESAFSGATSNERRQQDLVREVRRQQQEQLQERLASADPVVQRERAIQNARQRTLEQTIEPSERRRLQREIDESRRREREAAREAAQGPQLTAAQAAIAASQAAVGVAGATFLPGLTPEQQRAEARRGFPTSPAAAAAQADARERRAGVQAEIDAARTDRERREAALRGIAEEERRIRESITTGVAAFAPGETDRNEARRRALDELENLRVQLERGANAALNQAVEQTLQSALGVSSQIESALERLAESIGEGASITGLELNRANQALADAVERLRAARESGDEAGVQEAGRQVEATRELVAQSTSAANSLSTFAATLDRISTQLANTVAQEARSAADQARREANRAQGIVDAGGLGGRKIDAEEAAARAKRRAELAAESERIAARVRSSNLLAVAQFERAAVAGGLGADVTQLVNQRSAAVKVLEDKSAPEFDKSNAQASLEIINQQLQAAFEKSEFAKKSAEAADSLDKLAAAANRQEDLLNRGKDLLAGDASGAKKRRDEDIAAILAARRDALNKTAEAFGNKEIGRDEMRRRNLDAIRRGDAAIDEAYRQFLQSTAPTMFGLSEQAMNAVMQGPSRSALAATDISTVDGARELNRLIRGDDAARNQDLVQLQREANRLLEVIAEGQAGVAN